MWKRYLTVDNSKIVGKHARDNSNSVAYFVTLIVTETVVVWWVFLRIFILKKVLLAGVIICFGDGTSGRKTIWRMVGLGE